ncbi:MAG: glycoside hydrolase family 2 protein [Actinomycetes bacterium]
MTTSRALTDGWTVSATAGPVPERLRDCSVPATVPGVVHTDLLAAGLIPDPYLDDHESELSWIGRTEWRYTTSFPWQADGAGRHDLVCAGLDTLATVELNGTVLGRTANQHRSYRFDVTTLLRAGANDLVVTFASALDHAEQVDEREHRPHVNAHPYNAIRKMACNFGWDWGPDLVTAGIWRPIGIESWQRARIGSVRPLVTEAGAASATVTFHVQVSRAAEDAVLTVSARVGEAAASVAVPPGAEHVTLPVTVERPERWWPRGYGEQPLYDAEVVVADGATGLDSWRGRIGLRTIELDTADDGSGSPFIVRVNGEDVWVRGANWIPDDAFPSRVDRARYADRLRDATEANINLLRVWGGGIYESEDFYELCDERGILVWQDFLFACATYDEELLHDEVEAEAREAVTRLSAHASLAIWNGANENVWLAGDYGWRDQLAGKSWGGGFYDNLLPAIVGELDPTRPYIPNSPYSPAVEADPNDPSTGLVHLWDVWNRKDYTAYADHTPRFVSEFGFQGPPSWSTMTAAIHDDPLSPSSPVMLAHQKAEDGNRKLERGWQGHFPDPASLDDWHWTTQLNQARAIGFGIERFRSLAPYCRGTIVWQLNDCWPVVSWAAVDGYGRRKPLWHALRRAYSDRLMTVRREGEDVVLALINDAPEPLRGSVRVRRLSFAGEVLAEHVQDAAAAPRAVTSFALPSRVAAAGDPSAELLVADNPADDDVHRSVWFFDEDLRLALPAPRLTGSLSRVAGGYTLEVVAHTLVRDLTLHVDRLDPDATVDQQLVTLLPGERTRLQITSDAALDESALLTMPVLRTANDLVARR